MANTVGHPYPTELPLAELKRLYGFATGSLAFDKARAAHDAYHVLGYGIGMTLGEPGPLPIGDVTNVEPAEVLKAAIAASESGVKAAFDWRTVVVAVAQLLLEWLARS
jgi:hypothetical protein